MMSTSFLPRYHSSMPPDAPPDRDLRTFQGLRRIIALLRGPEGCPWDRVQTHESLRPDLVEETAEVVAALDEGDSGKLKEELGDLLFEVLIHVQLAEERGAFRMADVIRGVSEKLIRRHPHVFASAEADTPDQVVEQWDDLKAKERSGQTALAGIPMTLPALALAQAYQRRAARAGFGWESDEQAWAALTDELTELRSAGTPEEVRAESGDVAFALANLLRRLDVDAEDALRQTSRKFSGRFEAVERMAYEREIDLKTAEMNVKRGLWGEAKARGPESPR